MVPEISVPRFLLYYALPRERRKIALKGIVPKNLHDLAVFKPIQKSLAETSYDGVPMNFCVAFGDSIDVYDIKDLRKLNDFPTYMLNNMTEKEADDIEDAFMRKYYPDHQIKMKDIKARHAAAKEREDKEDYKRSVTNRGEDLASDMGIQPNDERARRQKARERAAQLRADSEQESDNELYDQFSEYFRRLILRKADFDVWIIDTTGLKAKWFGFEDNKVERGDQVATDSRIGPYHLDLAVKAGQPVMSQIKESEEYNPEAEIIHNVFEYLTNIHTNELNKFLLKISQENKIENIFNLGLVKKQKAKDATVNFSHVWIAIPEKRGSGTKPMKGEFTKYFCDYPTVDKGHPMYKELFDYIFNKRYSIYVGLDTNSGWCYLDFWYDGEKLSCVGIKSNPNALSSDDSASKHWSLGNLYTAIQMLDNPTAEGAVSKIKEQLKDFVKSLPSLPVDIENLRGHRIGQDLGLHESKSEKETAWLFRKIYRLGGNCKAIFNPRIVDFHENLMKVVRPFLKNIVTIYPNMDKENLEKDASFGHVYPGQNRWDVAEFKHSMSAGWFPTEDFEIVEVIEFDNQALDPAFTVEVANKALEKWYVAHRGLLLGRDLNLS